MASVSLDKFRSVSGLSDTAMSTDNAIQAITTASALANRLTRRYVGDVIEYVRPTSSNTKALIKVHGHKLPATGKVFLSGIGVPALTGVVSYTALNEHEIEIAGVANAPSVERGILCRQFKTRGRVFSGVAVMMPGPICFVEQIRNRLSGVVGAPFQDGSEMNAEDWYCDVSSPNMSCEIEIYRDVLVRRRVANRINPVVDRAKAEIEATYYAGFANGIPADLETAICAIAKEVAMDPSGSFQSENFEDYSYQRADPEIVRKMPTSAISTLISYRPVR